MTYTYNPIDLQNIVSKNEYYQEAVLIEKELSKRKHYFGFEKYIQQIFKEQFGKEVKPSICTKIFREIMIQLSLERDLKDYYDHSSLKNKFSYSDGEFKLKIHDGFIVTSLGNMTYINGRKYYDIEEQDLLDSYIDFIEDDFIIYVQYKHKHSNLFSFSFFKEYEKSKYEFNKLRHKKDIELVFDNKNVLYRAKSEK